MALVALLMGGVRSALTFWAAVPAPLKILLAAIVAFGLGDARGEHRAEVAAEAREQASIAAARASDAAARDDARRRAARQAEEAERRATQAEADLAAFARTATDRLEACLLGADADRLNAVDDGVPNDPLSEPRPKSSRGRRGDPAGGPVQTRPGDR